MVENSTLAADLLARLLLLQNMAALLPKQELSGVVCQGLADFPGVTCVSWELNGRVPSPDCLTLPLKYDESNYGALQLQLADPALIAPYEPYLQNFATMIAVILETKRKEESARTVQERFFELAPDLLCISNNQGRFVKLSQSWEHLLGWSRSQLYAKPFLEFVHPEDVAETALKYKQLLQGDFVIGFSHRFKNSDGEYRLLEWVCHPEKNQTIFAIARDITQIRAVQRELLLAASVYSNTNDAIFVCNENGSILSINPAFSRMTEYGEQEALNRHLSFLNGKNKDFQGYFSLSQQEGYEQREWSGENWVRKKSGANVFTFTNITKVKGDEIQGADADSRFVCVMRDITEQKSREQRIRELAYSDPLTGLANRVLLVNRLDHAISQSVRSKGSFAVIFIDLDNFKSINDSLGHDIGDEVLKVQARRLETTIRKSDTVARMGGDEFLVLTDTIDNIHETSSLARKILSALSEPLEINTQTLRLTCSIGLSLFPFDGNTRVGLMKNADTAMYEAKKVGRNCFRFFSSDMTDNANKRLQLENDLRKAIAQNQFEMYYQPKLSLPDLKIVGAEALIRWNHPSKGLVFPDDFIPFAEESNLINLIGRCVIENVVKQISLWNKNGDIDFPVAINLSGSQFSDGNVVKLTRDICLQYGVLTTALEVEVTETVIMNDPEQAACILKSFRDLGIRISIDDFGTGHSSLAYLKKLPLDILKIDKSFIRDIDTNADDLAIVETIVALAKALRLELVAEGVEREAHKDILNSFGVQTVQGYLFSRPIPADKFMDYCKTQWALQ